MSGYTPCEGSGQNAVNLHRTPGTPPGLGNSPTPSRTFGECPACGRVVAERGLTYRIKVVRHKAQVREDAPVVRGRPPEPHR